MNTTPENPPNPTPDAAATTPNVPDKKLEKKPSKKSEKPSEKPIYENFRHKSQTSTLSWLKNVGNKLIPWPKKNKGKVADEDDPEVDAVVDEELVEKIDGSEPAREVYGFDYEVLWLVRLLVKPEKEDFNFKRIGVVGMPDIGKSDVGRLIFNHESVKQHFAPRIWVPMAGKSTKDVVIYILKELEVDQELIKKWGKGTGVDDIRADGETEKKGVDALLYALNLKLVGKRYLIILDDVEEWTDKVEEENGTSAAPAAPAPPAPVSGTEKEELICDPFKFGFPKESGGAVLVTSRKKSVVKGMVDDNIYTPQPIKNADSNWDIYNSVLKRKIEFPTEDLKNEFKKKSGGLPVAARLMGKIKNKIIEEEKENEAGTDGSNRTTENGEGTNGNNKTTENVAETVGNSKTTEDVAATVGNNNTEQNGGVN